MIVILQEENLPLSRCLYRIEVNGHFVCRFELECVDNVINCLREAADAVELSEWAEQVMVSDAKGG